MVNDNASLSDGYEDVDEFQAPCAKIVHERRLARQSEEAKQKNVTRSERKHSLDNQYVEVKSPARTAQSTPVATGYSPAQRETHPPDEQRQSATRTLSEPPQHQDRPRYANLVAEPLLEPLHEDPTLVHAAAAASQSIDSSPRHANSPATASPSPTPKHRAGKRPAPPLKPKPDLSTITSGSTKPRSSSDGLVDHNSTTRPPGGSRLVVVAESDQPTSRPHMEEIFLPGRVAMGNGVGGDDSRGRSKTVPNGTASAVDVEREGEGEGEGEEGEDMVMYVNVAGDMGEEEPYQNVTHWDN